MSGAAANVMIWPETAFTRPWYILLLVISLICMIVPPCNHGTDVARVLEVAAEPGIPVIVILAPLKEDVSTIFTGDGAVASVIAVPLTDPMFPSYIVVPAGSERICMGALADSHVGMGVSSGNVIVIKLPVNAAVAFIDGLNVPLVFMIWLNETEFEATFDMFASK